MALSQILSPPLHNEVVGLYWFSLLQPVPHSMSALLLLQFWMDSLRIRHKWSLAWEGVSRIMILTYIFKVIQPWLSNKTHGSHRPRKVLEFDFCLEKCLIFQSALKICNFRWKLLFMGLTSNGPRNFMCLCTFQTFCTFDFNKLSGLDNFVIKSPITTYPVIGVKHGEYCNLVYGKLFHNRRKHLQSTRWQCDSAWKMQFYHWEVLEFHIWKSVGTMKLLKYGTSCCVWSTACKDLDRFFHYLAEIITPMRGCAMTFDLDLYPQSHSAMILK